MPIIAQKKPVIVRGKYLFVVRMFQKIYQPSTSRENIFLQKGIYQKLS